MSTPLLERKGWIKGGGERRGVGITYGCDRGFGFIAPLSLCGVGVQMGRMVEKRLVEKR